MLMILIITKYVLLLSTKTSLIKLYEKTLLTNYPGNFNDYGL
jgi:hypothetical protein